MERVFYNLLLNGCQAAQVCGGHVAVQVAEANGNLEIRITDDGPGVESSLRDKLFQPFVSHGKENGTGLGLTIAQKIVQDHERHLATGKLGAGPHRDADRASPGMQEGRHVEWPDSGRLSTVYCCNDAGSERRIGRALQIVAQRCDMKFARCFQLSRPAAAGGSRVGRVAVPGFSADAQPRAAAGGHERQRERFAGRTAVPGARAEGDGAATAAGDDRQPR